MRFRLKLMVLGPCSSLFFHPSFPTVLLLPFSPSSNSTCSPPPPSLVLMEHRRHPTESSSRKSAQDKARKEAAADEEGEEEEDKKRRLHPSPSPAAARRGSGGGGAPQQPCCQADNCAADLTEAKRYHRRHKVCEAHFKAAVVVVAGLRQRFCQQCSRFHELAEFDDSKRSCRRRLAGHNERRRKSSSETQGEDPNRCMQGGQDGMLQISLPRSPPYKHFQIR